MNEQRRFAEFTRDNSALLERIGVPTFVSENWQEWNYFLMHGQTSPGAPISFFIEDFDESKRALYLELLNLFFDAGFQNPGLMGLTESELRQLKVKFSQAFASK